MDYTDRDWGRLAHAVRRRRGELGLTQQEVRVAGGPSTATLRNIEGGHQTEYSAGVLARLERSLRWQPGSVSAVLAGGEPLPAAVPPPVGHLQQHPGRPRREIRLGDGPDAPDAAGLIQRLDESGGDLSNEEIAAAYEVLGRLYEHLGPERFEAWVQGARAGRGGRARRDAG